MAETANRSVDDLLSQRAQRSGSGRLGDPRGSAAFISFVAGFPDPASLPKSDVAESTRIALERDGEWVLQYGAARGYARLVDELLKKLKRDQGIAAGPENLLITYGASQALHLACEALVDPGDVILSEEPTWSGAVRTFSNAGAEVVTIPLTPEGTDVDALEQELARLRAEGRPAKLFYTIPNFQNPTGSTTTLARRQRIVRLAREYHLPIVEDDAYFDLRYRGERLPTIYSLDDAGLVMYLGTFSKIMAAGMRLGWVVAAPEIIGVLAGLKAEGGTSPFAGAVAAEFCASGTLVEHVAELTTLYHARRDTMLATLEDSMPAGTRWTDPDGGFFIWVTLPDGVRASVLAAQARERGVEFLPGTACHFSGGDGTLRLSYSFTDEDQIRRGIAILAELVRGQLTPAG
ncbi:MAG TPA: PLP-dependent aminotransferase family protein [Thermomicrobiaceae bacterium]|nr:PLP-dependent aminotransferase family protein [Thermomicrobiaceae bacterium]